MNNIDGETQTLKDFHVLSEKCGAVDLAKTFFFNSFVVFIVLDVLYDSLYRSYF